MTLMPPRTSQNPTFIRDSDIGLSSTTISESLRTFEDKPLVSLEEAVEPLKFVVEEVNNMIMNVKAICYSPANGLSIDESASIMLYTLDWTPKEKSFYFILNQTLRSQTANYQPWYPYLRLFTSSLGKLPPINNLTIYRGIKANVGNEYPVRKQFYCSTFLSCSSHINIIQDFLGQTGPRTLFTIECYSGKDISQHSYFNTEKEILIPIDKYFEVISNVKQGNEFHLIQLKEIEPPPIMSLHNRQLIDRIRNCSFRVAIDLKEQQLTLEDMNIVVNEAIINKQCTELNLQKNAITSESIAIIVSALETNSTLQKLWLDNNCLSDMGVRCLATILSVNKSILTTLGLNSNGITDEGAKILAKMLKTNKTLTYLRLTHNQISNQGIQLLADTLTHHNNTLTQFDISSNKLVNDSSIDYLIQMIIRNRTLSSLTILDCSLSENGKQKFRTMGQSKYGFKLCL
ncbi:unnamed protein product [Rotaria sordida]|uniref:NAD(P)(+)--arginine ADP-ribosyltransferase n=2 Tax=Rotaria sordida TaxID=392033 RepID=A0A815FLF5_9BILA|nr:unnamed protein product [Rotaria sordida]CAF1330460.1 unnamed protein product [Rotaria sordida]CAF3976173.1 unnamed protein product [Rotaria sordida]